jgi:DNA mismatch repair protein MutH
LEKFKALKQLNALVGTDLRPLADKLKVTVWKDEKINKGWAGHTVERYLGLPINSAQSPNFGSWELKVIPLVQGPKTGLRVKETMAITMIDPEEVKAKPFDDSHLYAKLRKIVIVARIFESQKETSSVVYSVGTFDLDNPSTYEAVRDDYEFVRKMIRTKGFEALSGTMGKLVQPRTKGPGHGSVSRAFYARTPFVSKIVGLEGG